jgi:leucyl-tRNA synthetase
MFRFLSRLWRLGLEVAEAGPVEEVEPDGPLVRKAHETIRKVSDDIERRFQFNTPIAAVTELVNDIYAVKDDAEQAAAIRFATETAVSLIQPYVPHITEELWQRLGHERLWKTAWPEADPAYLERETFELVVQVNGRVRGRVEVPAGLDDDELISRAKDLPRVAAHLDGKEVKKAIVVPGRLVNLVV